MLKPDEIKIPNFSKGIKGYNTQEVDNFINELVSEYRELYIKYVETDEKLTAVAEKYKHSSERATEALNRVKQMSEAIISDAQSKGEQIVSEANEKATVANEAMKASCAKILEEYSSTLEQEKQKLIEMDRKTRKFKEALLTAYKQHISDIQNYFPSIDIEEIENADFELQIKNEFQKKV